MKFLCSLKTLILALFLLIFTTSGYSMTFPERPSGPVADFAGIIDADTRLKVSSAARNLWIESKVGLAVATVEHTGGKTTEEYADNLFSEWGLRQSGTSAAVLVLISRKPADITIMYKSSDNAVVQRKFDELSGCTDIRSGEFGTGLLVLTAELIRTLNVEKFSNGVSTGDSSEGSVRMLLFSIVLVFSGILAAIVLARIRRFSGSAGSSRNEEHSQFRCIYSSGLFFRRGKKEQVRGGITG